MRTGRVASMIALAASSMLACTEDVGTCDEPLAGKSTVLVGGVVQYGGQAIMNRACATGCHASSARGAARNGAPAGLDFDIVPISEDEAEGAPVGDGLIGLSPAQVVGLRARQRKVFEERNRIWQQVKDGLMPPDGKFAAFRSLSGIFRTRPEAPCVQGPAYRDLDSKRSRDVLRNWLACGAPIVEAYGSSVTEPGVFDPIGAGTQYPACGAIGDGGVDGGTGVTLEMVQAQIFEPLCASCHPAVNGEVDLTSADSSYASLVEDDSIKCEASGAPYVTPGDPASSFLYDIVANDRPGCSSRMPQGGKLTAAQIKLISDWIAGGALREVDLQKARVDSLRGGLDAGL